MPKKQQLITYADFERMCVFSQLVNVYQDEQLIDADIKIVSHDEDIVKTDNGSYYIKSSCVFVRA